MEEHNDQIEKILKNFYNFLIDNNMLKGSLNNESFDLWVFELFKKNNNCCLIGGKFFTYNEINIKNRKSYGDGYVDGYADGYADDHYDWL